MVKFNVILTQSAAGDLDALSAKERVIADIRSLEDNPLPRHDRIKKLKGFTPPLYRLRSGDHRVLYRIEGRVVMIMRVIDRKILERILIRLK